MKIVFGYYEDEDFGLTEYPEISISEKEKLSDGEKQKKVKEYTKYLVTGIMEDFQYSGHCEQVLREIKKIENGKMKKAEWDGRAFQHEITKDGVKFTHTVFGECAEYPVWSCELKEYSEVLKCWNKFLKMEKKLETELEVEI